MPECLTLAVPGDGLEDLLAGVPVVFSRDLRFHVPAAAPSPAPTDFSSAGLSAALQERNQTFLVDFSTIFGKNAPYASTEEMHLDITKPSQSDDFCANWELVLGSFFLLSPGRAPGVYSESGVGCVALVLLIPARPSSRSVI